MPIAQRNDKWQRMVVSEIYFRSFIQQTHMGWAPKFPACFSLCGQSGRSLVELAETVEKGEYVNEDITVNIEFNHMCTSVSGLSTHNTPLPHPQCPQLVQQDSQRPFLQNTAHVNQTNIGKHSSAASIWIIHSSESYRAKHVCGTICYVIQIGCNFYVFQ